MKELMDKGKRRLCFIVKSGEENDIVIWIDSLAVVDYKRLSEIESQGGEMMRVMRDTTIEDNGMNALSIYKDVLVVVPKKVAPAPVQKVQIVQPVKEVADENPTPVQTKRRAGRPKGSKNKQKS